MNKAIKHNIYKSEKVVNLTKNVSFSNNGRYKHEFEEQEPLVNGALGVVHKVKHLCDEQYYAMKKWLLKVKIFIKLWIKELDYKLNDILMA